MSSDRAPARPFMAAAIVVAVLWILYHSVQALLLSFFGLVLAIALSAPVTWLEGRGWRRWIASLLVFGVVVLFAMTLGWLVIPRLAEQLYDLAQNLPMYAEAGSKNLSHWLESAPGFAKDLSHRVDVLSSAAPNVWSFATRIGHLSMSFLGWVVMIVFVATMILYIVVDPRPLLRGYLQLVPDDLREPCARALSRSGAMTIGWMRANLVVGAIEAVAAAITLSLLGIPAPLVWAALTFFAEFIPRLGPYLMAIPPAIVALSVSPLTTVWVVIFYILLNEVTGNFVVPYVRGRAMQLHPALLVFAAVVLGFAFGLLGAVISTPVVAFVVAYVEELVLKRRELPPDPRSIDDSVEAILHRKLET